LCGVRACGKMWWPVTNDVSGWVVVVVWMGVCQSVVGGPDEAALRARLKERESYKSRASTGHRDPQGRDADKVGRSVGRAGGRSMIRGVSPPPLSGPCGCVVSGWLAVAGAHGGAGPAVFGAQPRRG
jgi:hypothetical protein